MRFVLVVEDEESLKALVKRLKRHRGRVRFLEAVIVVDGDPAIIGPVSRGVAKARKLEPLELRVSLIVL